jgi:hypothetical protein
VGSTHALVGQRLGRYEVVHALGVGGMVDDAVLVCDFQRVGDLPGNGECLVDGKGPLCDTVRQRGTLDELEDQRLRAVAFLNAVNRRDMRIIQRSEDLRFTCEAGETVRVERNRRREHFQRNVALQLGVAGALDFAHAARAKQADDFVGTHLCAGWERHGETGGL